MKNVTSTILNHSKMITSTVLGEFQHSLILNKIDTQKQNSEPQKAGIAKAIGYKQTEKALTPVNGEKEKKEFGKENCKNCNVEFEKKAHNQVYCCEVCRIEFYEKKTGKKLDNLKLKHTHKS